MNEKMIRKIFREEIKKVSIPSVLTPELLTPEEVSSILKVPKGTLSNWRSKGRGPAYRKLTQDGAVRYELADIVIFINERQIGKKTDN
jgi:hypothetical protein